MFLRVGELISYNNILALSKSMLTVGLEGRNQGQRSFEGKIWFLNK